MGQVTSGLSNIFGSTDGLDAAGNALGKGATADQLGITSGQLFARKALAGGLGGLGKGLQSMQQPPNPGAPPINVPQAPMVDPRMFGRSNPYFGS